jgi:protein gp37
MYQRFKWNPKIGFELHDHVAIDRLQRKNISDGSRVFICSTFELFHPKVPKSWRKDIFSVIECNSKNTFQILTKFPQNIDCPMPDNVWLGATITCRDELHRILKIKKTEAKIKFISFEPVLGNLPIWWGALKGIDWIIIGKLTGFGHKYDVSSHIFKRRTAQILLEAKRHNIPIFLKNNLKEIWREPLIQEFPEINS